MANTMALASAMTYDRMVNAIGPFELSEYLGLVLVYAALAMTARLRTERREGEQNLKVEWLPRRP